MSAFTQSLAKTGLSGSSLKADVRSL